MERKAITIIEFDYHAEVLVNALKIFIALNEYQILLFVSDKVWQQVSSSLASRDDIIKVYIAKNYKEIKHLIETRLKEINNSKAIFFNTLASNFRFFNSVEFTPPVILRIHNSNTYFNPLRSINPKLTPFFIWKDTSYWILHVFLKQDTIYRKKFVQNKVDYFQFPSLPIAEYALNNHYLPPNKLFPTVPYVFMQKVLPNKNTGNTVNIVILGGIDKRRRNYKQVLEAFKLVIPTLDTSVKLSLVGKPYGFYGRIITQKFKKLENKHLKIEVFNSFVPQNIFNKITTNANFLLIPTVKETRYKIYKELYGFTKISGNINDMILYQKPALVPAFYPLEESIQNHTEIYEDTDSLAAILKKWILDKEYEKYEIKTVLKDYFFDSIVKNTMEGLQKIIKKSA